MYIKLVAKTEPRGLDNIKSSSDFISYAARVSNPDNQNNPKTAEGLLKYCLKHKHFSIFEMINIVYEIETTRDISRQILRHRSFSFQEFSQRYSEPQALPILREARTQDTENRQNSIKTEAYDIIEAFKDAQNDVWNKAFEEYEYAISNGIAKEQARVLLPEGLTATRMYMNGSLRSWIHYIIVRCGIETQKEHRDIAKAIARGLIAEFPFLGYLDVLDDNYSAETE